MSHERMLKSERQLEGEMRALLRKAELIDAQEDGQYGKGKRGDELPEELQRRSSRLEWIRKAKAELEAEAAAAKARQRDEQAEAVEQEATEAEASADEQRSKRAARRARGARKRADDAQKLAIETALAAGLESPALAADRDPLAMPSRQLSMDATGQPQPQAQRNFTDPDSHILKGSDGWIQGYNAQAAVDGDHQVIVAIGVSNQASCQATSAFGPPLCIIKCYLFLVSRQDWWFPLSAPPFRLIASTPAAALLGLYAIP